MGFLSARSMLGSAGSGAPTRKSAAEDPKAESVPHILHPKPIGTCTLRSDVSQRCEHDRCDLG